MKIGIVRGCCCIYIVHGLAALAQMEGARTQRSTGQVDLLRGQLGLGGQMQIVRDDHVDDPNAGTERQLTGLYLRESKHCAMGSLLCAINWSRIDNELNHNSGQLTWLELL